MTSTASAASQDPTPLFDVSSKLGPAFAGMLASVLLFGISIPQIYRYYQKFPNDWVVYRASVALLWFFDALNLVLTVHCVYYYLIFNFGNYLALDVIVWSFKLRIAIDMTIVIVVHCLYCLRLWKLSGRGGIVARNMPFLVVINTGFCIVLVIKIYRLYSFSGMVQLQWIISLAMGVAAVVDLAIAGAMCYSLYGTRSAFATTNSKISTMILWSSSTGLVTCLFTLATLLTNVTMPNSLIFLAFEFLLGELYSNSLLAMLNARTSTNQAPKTVNKAGASLAMIIDSPQLPIRAFESTCTRSRMPVSKEDTPLISFLQLNV